MHDSNSNAGGDVATNMFLAVSCYLSVDGGSSDRLAPRSQHVFYTDRLAPVLVCTIHLFIEHDGLMAKTRRSATMICIADGVGEALTTFSYPAKGALALKNTPWGTEGAVCTHTLSRDHLLLVGPLIASLRNLKSAQPLARAFACRPTMRLPIC